MRAILTIALLICLAALLGWVSFSDQGDTASINIDKQEAQEETEQAVEAVEEAVEDVSDGLERQFNSDESDSDADEEADNDEVEESLSGPTTP